MANVSEETMPRRGLECSSECPGHKKKKTRDVQNDDDFEDKTLSEHKKKKKKKSKDKGESMAGTVDEKVWDKVSSKKMNSGSPIEDCDSDKFCEDKGTFQESKDIMDNEQNDSYFDNEVLKKKKKKIKLNEGDSQTPPVAEANDESHIPGIKEKKKKKKRKRVEEEVEEEYNEETDFREDKEDRMKKKKKKTKDSRNRFELLESDHSSDQHEHEEERNNSQSKHEDSAVSNGGKEVKKKKKKDKIETSQEFTPKTTEGEDENEINNGAQDESNSQVKRKKKKKKNKDQDNENFCTIEEEEQNEISRKAKKKKKNKEDNEEDQTDQTKTKTNRKSNLFKDSVFESSEREEQFSRVTGKPLHADYVGEKTLGKKNEGKESSSVNDNNNDDESTKSNPVVTTGQWQGALFENEQRQNKFLRLLGGMKSPNTDRKNLFSSGKFSQKKGLYGSLSASVPNLSRSSENIPMDSKGGNKALSVSQAADVEKRLEDDYNKAMNFKLSGSRGAGLGFTPDPAAGKKFHIDANATKSIKFDED